MHFVLDWYLNHAKRKHFINSYAPNNIQSKPLPLPLIRCRHQSASRGRSTVRMVSILFKQQPIVVHVGARQTVAHQFYDELGKYLVILVLCLLTRPGFLLKFLKDSIVIKFKY